VSIENLSGTVFGDTLIGDHDANRLEGSGGNDTLDGQGGDDRLTGGVDNPIVVPTAGSDDTMTGGTGNDTFVFRPNGVEGASFGHDTITDFVAGAATDDVIEFSQTFFADFAAVLAASAQDGADVVITYDAASSVRLQNVLIGDLHADDFLFV
jgi:Ca2+-binding RTX toxin-like protein